MNLSRRKFLLGVSAAAAAAVAKANLPSMPIEPGAYLSEQPAWVPEGWLYPDGRHLLRSQYPRLFAAIGTHWGSDGPLTFRMPDLRTSDDAGIFYVMAGENEIDGGVYGWCPPGSIVALFRRKYVG